MAGEICVDGVLEEAAWRAAPRSPRFVDIITGQSTLHNTQALVVWDERSVYVAYCVEEPNVQAKYLQHNDPIYYDNDVELFVAGRDAYYEFELNAYNTCYEVFFIWEDAYESAGFSKAPEFKRAQLKPFNGVGYTTHPRGGNRFGIAQTRTEFDRGRLVRFAGCGIEQAVRSCQNQIRRNQGPRAKT